MASVFLSSILPKISRQVSGFIRRWAISPSSSSDPRSSVLKDLEKLERTLRRIQAALHDAEEREIREDLVKLWLKELKELAYDAEDVLDEYQYEVLRAQVEGRASLKGKRVEGDDEEEVSIPNSMGDKIRKIRERFDEISEDRERLRLREEDGQRRVLEAPYPAPTSHMVDESSIYGREDDKQKVIDLLFSEGVGNGLFVIPIVGKGGLGKTTIAQLVYNDPKVKQYFHLTGWVCVSDDFDVPRLTKAIIESLTRSSCDLTQLSTLQDRLKEEVKGKRVVLVLDDVWNEQQSRWGSLRNPFIGAETVTIIVTCRNDSVAEIIQTVHPYHPRCLSPEQSWSLFRHYAFGDRDPEEQPRLADMGKQIVKKCSGLPLALKSVGSFLRCTADEDSWMDVIESDVWEVDENDEILPALRLSYSRMPAHLKPCFVYCSMFPKDHVFVKHDLVRLWMAQGYIPSGSRRSMEEIGNEYFNDLQRRSFFDSVASAFMMHDMIHDLAKSITGNECCAIVDKKLPGCLDEVRHVYVEYDEEFVKSLHSYNFSGLRTMLLQPWYTDRIVIQKIIKIKYLPLLRCLRSLEFRWEREDEIPDLFGNLKHLRYLSIASDLIKKLPESICLLYHLQTLLLNCSNLAELPDGLGNLTNLQYLRIGNSNNPYLPVGIRNLTNLQRFYGSSKVQGGIGVLKDLENLHGSLYISGLRNLVDIQDARDAGLKYKHKLEELRLNYWDDHYGSHDEELHLEASPKEYEDDPAGEKREEAILEYLQPHSNLKKLLIEGYGGSKFPEWVGNPLSFASLQEIHISYCDNIRSLPLYIHDSLRKSDAPIPKSMLVRVDIMGCQQLTSIAGLHNLHTLEHLEIGYCSQLLILSEEGLPSKLEYLQIEECQQLPSLSGMQNLTSLKTLIIKNCRKLQIMAEDQLSSMPALVEVVDCPRLSNWCLIQNINCIQVVSGNKCTISNTWEKIMHGFNDLTSTDMLCFSNSWKNLSDLLEELTIWSVTHMPQPECSSLRSLVIKDCRGIQCLPCDLLPSTLESMVVDSCEDLTCLPLAQQNRDAFEELQLVNCPKLERVEGLNCLFFLKILRIEQCPQLRLPQDDRQQSIPPRVEIAGAVSPIFDAADEGDMGEFLQLGLPSSSSSQSTVQITAQPLNLTKLQSFYGSSKVQGGIGVLKDLANLHGSLYISGLKNLVDIQDARDAGLKYKHKLEELRLNYWADHFGSHDEELHLEASPKEYKDDPADEKREEAILEYLQPHSNLKKLLIEGYGGSKFPEWVGNPLSFASLQEIHISYCDNIRSLPLYIHDSLGKSDAPIPKSMLVRVDIIGCQQLTSIAGLHNLHTLEHLEIGYCSQLLILSEEGLPSKLEYLQIEECQQLISLSGMQNLTSLETLIIKNCCKLQIMAEDQLSSMPAFVEVVDCPRLSNWCLIQNINCIQVVSGRKWTISNTWEKIMHGFDDWTSTDMLYFRNSWEKLFYLPEELTIWSVTHMPQPGWLWPHSYLVRLVIKDCPRIQSLPCHLLPSTLKSLVVESCEDLTCLPLVEEDRYAFEELQLVNCPKLEWVEGLNCLFFPKILRIEGCPQLQLPQHDQQPCIPPRVSSIFDEADEGDMGEFLQLGLPSGSSSQSMVQITAEPSN